jgi:hypothetical protein
MKKFLIGDLMKDLKSERISYLIDKYGITESDAIYIVDTFSLSSEQEVIATVMTEFDVRVDEAEELYGDHGSLSAIKDADEVAEALGVGITEVEGDDIDNYFDMGGGTKGEVETTVGTMRWLYDNASKVYVVSLIMEGTPIMYNIPPNIMKDWKNSDSAGEYYNSFVRGNKTLEENAVGSFSPCGCGPNPCDPGQIDQFNARYSSLK